MHGRRTRDEVSRDTSHLVLELNSLRAKPVELLVSFAFLRTCVVSSVTDCWVSPVVWAFCWNMGNGSVSSSCSKYSWISDSVMLCLSFCPSVRES